MSTGDWVAVGVAGALLIGSGVFGYLYGTAKARREASRQRAHLEQIVRPPDSRPHRGPSNSDQPPSRVVRGRMRQKRRNWSR